MRRTLHVLVAEGERSRALRGLVETQRRIRHAATEQECLDIAAAGAADVMVINLDDAGFGDPGLPARVRFASRNAFPVLGVGTRGRVDAGAWIRGGLHEILYWEELNPARLDRCLRHWVRHRSLRRRVRAADRRALQWWTDLVAALDEVRGRLERGSDALDAFLGRIETQDGEIADQRRHHLLQARKQLADLNQIAADLDIAARTIQLKGLERRQRQAQRGFASRDAYLQRPWDEEEPPCGDPSALDPPRDERYRFGS
ncbi:MAG: hypothetical protein FJY75_05870 [Candidatus Eisenbacteria bacterium]|uniref:Uncharacterized protein n=1 Tax=Eiseniibacteriota bacterium TaxID=2212470 RepID=A0A937X809_UNCEI|nr:hypothetical protein [Candidatus Eisenbacteria bacterium]